jgi:hypothetical protein
MAHHLKFILILVGTVSLAGLGVLGYFVAQTPEVPPSGVAYYPQGEAPPFRAPSIEGERLYAMPLLKFSLYYPDDLIVREYGKANTSTITFEDEDGERGFQVFVVPYEGEAVTAERFAMDIPSGVRLEEQQIFIDGVPASIFFSKDMLLGETREVWFVHNGFLYEVTAHKTLDAWLSQIMKTWEFIR